jgi:hypothetical protein
VDRTGTANIFYPSSFRTMDTNDADFGASSPVYIDSPSPMVAAISKDGHLYLMNSKNLGGVGGQLADLVISVDGPMAVHTAPAAYATAQGMHIALTTNFMAQCPSGGPTGTVVMSVLIPAGSPPVPRVLWCAATSAAALGFPASPMATTTDGKSEAVVWFINGTKLMGVDGDTGATVFGGGAAADACTGVHKWTAPIAVKGRIIVAGDGHLCSWSAH